MSDTVNHARFSYRDLCAQQAITVTIPDECEVIDSEINILIDLMFKTSRIFYKIDKLKAVCIEELRFAEANNNQIHAVSFTSTVSVDVNNAYKDLINEGGLITVLKNITKQNITDGFRKLIPIISTPVNILYAQLESILVYVINKKKAYDKYGSANGVTPTLDLKDAIGILEKLVQVENYLYDMLYALGVVALTSLKEIYQDNANAELSKRLAKYELFTGEGDKTLKLLFASFNPATRFIVDDSENIMFNL